MSVPVQWRTKKQRYSLQGGICPKCSNAVFPPRSVCPHCSREQGTVFGSAAVQYERTGAGAGQISFVMPAVSEPLVFSVAGDD